MRRGSVYTFVVFSMFLIFMLLTVTLRATSDRAFIVHTHLRSTLEYDLARDSITRRVAELNQILQSNVSSMLNDIPLHVENIMDYVVFNSGYFYVERNPHAHLIASESDRILRNLLNVRTQYIFNTPEASIDVTLFISNIGSDQFFITSEARNCDGLRRAIAHARVAIDVPISYSISAQYGIDQIIEILELGSTFWTDIMWVPIYVIAEMSRIDG